MTRYTVVWHGSTLDDLAQIWTGARDRNAVTLAAHIIDLELSHDATTKGVDVSEGLRAYVAQPLRILFTVDDEDRLVEILRVGRL